MVTPDTLSSSLTGQANQPDPTTYEYIITATEFYYIKMNSFYQLHPIVTINWQPS
jgi:hypothetical protein